MQVAVLGTGTVGRTLAGRLDELGHDVTIGTRDAAATRAREEYAAWAAEHPGVAIAPFAGCATGADVVVNAVGGAATVGVLEQVGSRHLAGKILVDVSNPLDFSAGFPPRLFTPSDDSLGEQVQRAHPAARVVKTLNTLAADLMVDPQRLGEAGTVFVSGDDEDAKQVVTGLLGDLGHRDVVDLGGIESARGPEMYLSLWLRVLGAVGTPSFNLKIVR